MQQVNPQAEWGKECLKLCLSLSLQAMVARLSAVQGGRPVCYVEVLTQPSSQLRQGA